MGLGEQGLYHQGTRFLSHFVLQLGPARPLLLSSTVKEDNALLTVDLTNPDLYLDGRLIPRGSLHLFRAKFLWQGRGYERLRIKNYGAFPVTLPLRFQFDSDFADIFEVRGTRRPRRGERAKNQTGPTWVLLPYRGLDAVVRQLRLECTPAPAQLSPSSLCLEASLEPNQETTFLLTATCESFPANPRPAPSPPSTVPAYESAFAEATAALKAARARSCEIYTSNEQFNDWLNRSLADLEMMMTDTPQGPYPDAGVPWFSTRFGRDGIITALETLWVNPEIAAGVLRYLAASQAREANPEQEAEPGKILHETRQGEMAALGEVPFGRYYGSVDATPLFVLLAAAYFDCTGDLPLLRQLWPHVELALEWIDRYGDLDGDGFVEYARRSSKGLVQQGWKDSQDSVFHSDGSPAEGPIAPCEVQGYVYAAKRGAARLAAALGQPEKARALDEAARKLQAQFEQAFWCEELSSYALALDGQKRPCRVPASNAGHALFSGIALPERAARTAATLLSDAFFSGWGVRTLAATATAYNPMSYHNGSVWPHDNALIASGLSRYAFKQDGLRILTGLFDASLFLELHRLPELFCGFPRRPGEGPTLYPVACSPQSWAAAA
ncbi:MAG: glycogen debranching N-terminal domain-containing protein, partial [Planctomycetota bacterium]